MEVGVKVWVENAIAGSHQHIASAYLTFVAIDSNGRRVPVPPITTASPEETRRFDDAGRRRERREQEKERKRQNRVALETAETPA
jgi:acyl-CoA hydrolase